MISMLPLIADFYACWILCFICFARLHVCLCFLYMLISMFSSLHAAFYASFLCMPISTLSYFACWFLCFSCLLMSMLVLHTDFYASFLCMLISMLPLHADFHASFLCRFLYFLLAYWFLCILCLLVLMLIIQKN